MKKIISGIVCMAFTLSSMAVPGNVIADAVNLETVSTINATDPGTLENGLAYETYEDHVEITGCSTSAEGEIIIPDTIQGLPVTSISVFAFDNCSSLTSVIIPDSVVEIGWSAFNFCVALQSVTIPDGVTSIGTLTFSGCKSLESVTIPDSVTSIGERAFSDCYALQSISIPKNVTEIWGSAFSNCTSLAEIRVDPENQNYMDMDGVLFSNDQTELHCYPAGKSDQAYTIPEHVANISDCAFYGCSSLTSITIPESVTSIGNSAFYGCQSLESIAIPDGIKDIKDNTFSRCFALQSVTIPDRVTRIGLKAFWDCSALASITIPDGVTRIDEDAFEHCSALTSVTIPESVTSIGSRAFFGCSSLEGIYVDPKNQNYMDRDGILFSKDQKILLQYLPQKSEQSYSIPDGVTSIEERAFSDCSALRSVTIPDSVTDIGNYAFYQCEKLESVTIPAHVTNIELCAFYCCFSLESATILNPDCEIDDNKKTISDTAVIYGYPGSTAQTYAEKYNREFIALDENPDTTVNKYLKYEIHEDYVEITRCDTSAEGEIMIPATIQGLPVTSIGMGAFEYCSSLETVIIPESVVTISEEAFWRCSALKAVTISENVVNIELNAFFGCSALESITIQNPDCEIDDDKNTLSDTVVIYGYPGSTAQAYAEKYNREFIALDENPVNSEILWGDANCDNSVDIADVVLMNRVYVGVDQVSTQGLLNADVDQSGKIELADSMNVLKLLVHLLEPDNFPIS